MQHNKDRTGRRLILTAVYAAYILFIFSNSMQDADASTVRSSAVLELMREFIDVTFGQFFPAAASFLTEHIIRKAAHFTEFALLGALGVPVFMAYAGREVIGGSGGHMEYGETPEDAAARRNPSGHTQTAVYAAFAGLITALTDETIQLYSAGRSSQVTDVWIDFAGCLAGIAVCTAISRIADRRNK